MRSDLAISCRSLGKVYHTGFLRRAVIGVERLDLSVERGEIFGFIGPNGAGKTTTIKCLVGLQAATSGQAWLLGTDHRNPEARRRVGFLPERPYFYQHLTATEFLDFYARLFNIEPAVRRRRCEELLDMVGLTRNASTPLREYSKGMLQRAGVAQALINEPDLIILDEPMSGLDPLGRMLIRDLILHQREQGRTVFFSSHILSDVQSICDRIGLLVGGRLQACGRVDDLIDQQVRHVDCTVQVPDDIHLPGREVTRQGRERLVRVASEQVQATIKSVMAAGGQIVQVQPARQDLETILVDAIQRADSAQSPLEEP